MSDQEYPDINSRLEFIARMQNNYTENQKVRALGLSGFTDKDDKEDAKAILSYRDEYLAFMVNHRATLKNARIQTYSAKSSHDAFLLKNTLCNTTYQQNYVKEGLKLFGATFLGLGILEFEFLFNAKEPNEFLLLLGIIGLIMVIIGLFLPTAIKSEVVII